MKREPDARAADWRRPMRRELMWLLAIKFAALVGLWLLCFSPGHRQRADASATSRQLQLGEKGND